jgi:endonuclease III related protein
MTIPQQLMTIYQRLLTQYGPRDWWPAESPEEVIIGAILVQNVAWSNVEKAISELRKLQLLDFRAILAARVNVIEAAIRPTRFYRSKATKLQTFAAHLQSHYAFDLHRLFNQPPEHLRDELLSIHGIGAETADDIVLYAAEKPTFVIDRYTKRIFSRLGLTTADMPYEDMRQWFLTHLPNDTLLFNEYHALIDAHGHFTCLPKNPLCDDCSLAHLCVTMTAASSQSTRVLTD